MHGIRFSQRIRIHLGHADVLNVAGLHQVGDRTNHLFNRDIQVHSGRLVQIDVLHIQPFQRIREIILNMQRSDIQTVHASVRRDHRPEFDG
ncbi:hypothetical protein D3C73_903030 [compost metagenome]